MQHLDEGTIHAWLDGALAGDEAAGVARHVDTCGDCAAMVAEARGMIAATGRIVSALDDVPAGVIPTPRPTRTAQHSLWRRLRFTPARAALAATVLLTVGTLFATRRNAKDIVPAEPSITTTAARPDSVVKPERREVAAATVGAGSASPAAAPPPVVEKRKDTPAAGRNSAAVSQTRSRVDAATASTGATSALRAGAPSAPAPSPASAPPAADVAVVAATPGAAAKSTDARPSLQRAALPMRMTDSMAPVADTAAAVAAGRRKLEKVLQLEAVTTTGALSGRTQQNDPQGCYKLQGDSASAPRGVPLRFALQVAPGSGGNVVRAMSPEGRVDSIMAGSTWRRAAPGSVTVSFATFTEQQPTLHLTTGGSVGQVIAGGRAVNVSVERVDCRP